MSLVCRRWYELLKDSVEAWRYLCLPKTTQGFDNCLAWILSRQSLRPKYVCDDEDIYFPGSSRIFKESNSKPLYSNFLHEEAYYKDVLLKNLAIYMGPCIEEICITRSQSIGLGCFLAELPCLKVLQVSAGLVDFRDCIEIASTSLELRISDASVLFTGRNNWDSIKALDLSYCQLHVVDGLNNVSLRNLKSLKLTRCKFIKANYSKWQMESLEELVLNKCDASCRKVELSKFSATLKHLVLVNALIHENADDLKFDKLESLVLRECDIHEFPFSKVPSTLKFVDACRNSGLMIGNHIDIWNVETLKLSLHQIFIQSMNRCECEIDRALGQGYGNVVHLSINVDDIDCMSSYPLKKFRNLPKLKNLSIMKLANDGESRFTNTKLHWTWIAELIELQRGGVDVGIMNVDSDDRKIT
jgi:hypothetical protein